MHEGHIADKVLLKSAWTYFQCPAVQGIYLTPSTLHVHVLPTLYPTPPHYPLPLSTFTCTLPISLSMPFKLQA